MVTITNTENELTFNLKLEGAQLEETKAFLTFKTENKNIQVPIIIEENGKCRVKVEPGTVEFGAKGEMLIEVIAKDMHFTPWSDTFLMEQKQAKVETKEELVETIVKPEPIKEEKQPETIESLIKRKDVLIEMYKNTPNTKLKQTIKALNKVIANKVEATLTENKKAAEKAEVIAESVTKKIKLSPEKKRMIIEHYTKKLKK